MRSQDIVTEIDKILHITNLKEIEQILNYISETVNLLDN